MKSRQSPPRRRRVLLRHATKPDREGIKKHLISNLDDISPFLDAITWHLEEEEEGKAQEEEDEGVEEVEEGMRRGNRAGEPP